jgi:8-oxo-dGTP pyrophosphatase MutT (NUDIX family)
VASGKWSWDTAHETTGSGIVIVREGNRGYYPLGLWAHGGYDIPKGHVEPGDDIFNTATREAEEEAGITELEFCWGMEYVRLNNLFVYVARTTQQPKIAFNREEGLYEHEYCKWPSWEEMKQGCYDYLLPAIEWAENRIINAAATE